MWIYEKRLQYPIKITTPNPGLAKLIAAQYGGPHAVLLQKTCRKALGVTVLRHRLYVGCLV